MASQGDGAGLEGTGKGGGGDSSDSAGRAEEGEGLGAGGENVAPGGKGGTADKRQKGAKDGKEDAGESDGDRVSGEGTSQDGPADSSGSAKDAIDVPIPPWLEPHSEGLYTHELREFVRYRRLGYRTGVPDDPDDARNLWLQAHSASLDDYGLHLQSNDLLYHPEAARFLFE